MPSRRHFLQQSALAAGGVLAGRASLARGPRDTPDTAALLAAAAAPVVIADRLPSVPLLIETVELLRRGRQWLVRVRADGAEGLAVVHGGILEQAYLLFTERVGPAAIGTDARAWEATLEAIYLGRGGAASNYKWQGLPFWVAVSSLEMAVLDLLGHAAGLNVTELLGDGRVRDQVAVYRASSNRDNTAEEEVARLQELVERTGARALKHKLGARMVVTDASEARDRALVPAVRAAFPDLTLYADANGSFDVAQSLTAAERLVDHGYAFFEEPVRFDHYDETVAVAAASPVPIAGGEQESSLRQFLWLIDHGAVQITQPDLFYFGGLIRSIRVARASRVAGLDCTPHISGYGLGFLYAALFAACVDNAGPYHEYKGLADDLPAQAVGGRLEPVDGVIEVPTGPGLGVAIDPDWLAGADAIASSISSP
ncbi:MAG: mandelate racemase/muconate lactonizing enzyme family protein [Bacteroidota bacterium]